MVRPKSFKTGNNIFLLYVLINIYVSHNFEEFKKSKSIKSGTSVEIDEVQCP